MEQHMTKNLSIPRGSVEYIEATVTADVSLTMPVELSLSRGTTHTWLPATWQGAAGTTRTAQTTAPITLGDDYPAAAYSLFARLTDTPEQPIIACGMVTILGTPNTVPVPDGWIDGGTP
jgi:hypothetical protein